MLRKTRQHILTLIAFYGALATYLTWPAMASWGEAVPGSERTDLWNSLWSIWFVAESLANGTLPYATELLNFPKGGSLLVSDPMGCILATPFVWLLGISRAYTLLVLAQLTFAGAVAHRFGEALAQRLSTSPAGAWIAGVGYASAPILISGVHNGTAEAFAGGWPALAALAMFQAAQDGTRRHVLWAVVALVLTSLSSWYGVLVAFIFAGTTCLLVKPKAPTSGHPKAPWVALCLGVMLVLPMALMTHQAATKPGNFIGIKTERELATVRRTTGPADPLGYLIPGDYRSPDFREISRYGEAFFHCHYLGWTLLIGSLLAVRRRGLGFLWLAGGVGLLLSLGPVLARFGSPVIIMGDRAIPLPYLLVESLPGFSSLSLVYRLALAPALAVSLLAGIGWTSGPQPVGQAHRVPRAVFAVVAALLLEGRFASPIAASTGAANSTIDPAIATLADKESGAVMNFPIVGGRAYLYEQTVHRMPLAATLNFPNNAVAQRMWKTILQNVDAESEQFKTTIHRRAKQLGIRYLVVHEDPLARPDMHDTAVRKITTTLDPVAGDEPAPGLDTSVRVYELW